MAYFKEQQLKKLPLSNPDYWVEILTDLQYGDIKKFAAVTQEGDVDFQTAADTFLQTVIKSWNLDDDQGNVLPITPENIDRLTKDDALLIVNEAGGLVEDEAQKKTSQKQ
jgi:hypothetical protein